jgi:hypothetical protein
MDEVLPAEVFHPMDYLADELRERGWGLFDFAMRLANGNPEEFRKQRAMLDFYALRNPGIYSTAEDFANWERVLGIDAEFWMNCEVYWKKHRERTGYVAISPELDEPETPR